MGIQISGLLSNQAFDWKSVVDQLIAADSIPITKLQNEQTQNLSQVAALSDIYTSLQSLQDSVQSIRTGNPFQNRTVASDNAGSSWKANSAAGATIGTYKFEVQSLATATNVQGGAHVGQNLNATSADLSGLTVTSLPTATQVTTTDSTGAYTFTVNGKTVTFHASDSLKSVLDQITTATNNDVTWSYAGDQITLTSASGGPMVLGAANDTTNFLQVMKLNSSSGASTTSTGTLGTMSPTAKLASARLSQSITAVDASGNGSFVINGVTINYNVNNDALNDVLGRINSSTAGVNATYDPSTDRVVLTNKSTGYTGMAVSESAGGLLGALNLTSGGTTAPTMNYGTNTVYRVNGGAWITSPSNTLDSTSHGITGLSVTVNTTGTETLTVSSDNGSMQTAIQDYLTKFNALQDLIDSDTNVTVSGGSVTTSVLSNNREVQGWATQLQSLAFGTVSGITGTVTHLDDLGIDFDGTTGHLIIKDTGKLQTALTNHPDDVQSYFLDSSHGIVTQMFNTLTNLKSNDSSQRSDLGQANSDLSDQITALQAKLADERTTLTNAFISMLDAQSAAQSQQQSLNGFFNQSSNSCWVARAVYGEHNPRWLLFRHWLLSRAPTWFRRLYLRHGEAFARWLADKPRVCSAIRRWMDSRIAGLSGGR